MGGFFGCQGARDSGWNANSQHSPWNGLALADQSGCAYNCVRADMGVGEHNGLHTDQHMMIYGCAMYDRPVSDRAFIADNQRGVSIHVQRAIILYVGAPPDHDRSYVTAHNGVIPDACALVNSDIADDHCAGSDKYIVRDSRRDAVKRE